VSVDHALNWLRYNGGRGGELVRAIDYVKDTYFSSAAERDYQRREGALSVVMVFSVGK